MSILSSHVLKEEVLGLKLVVAMDAFVEVHLPPDEVDELDLLVEGELALILDLLVVEGVDYFQVVK